MQSHPEKAYVLRHCTFLQKELQASGRRWLAPPVQLGFQRALERSQSAKKLLHFFWLLAGYFQNRRLDQISSSKRSRQRCMLRYHWAEPFCREQARAPAWGGTEQQHRPAASKDYPRGAQDAATASPLPCCSSQRFSFDLSQRSLKNKYCRKHIFKQINSQKLENNLCWEGTKKQRLIFVLTGARWRKERQALKPRCGSIPEVKRSWGYACIQLHNVNRIVPQRIDY